jgi:F0F1-type ATP synthase membrane subunit b/b'
VKTWDPKGGFGKQVAVLARAAAVILVAAGTAMAQEGEGSPGGSNLGMLVKWLNFAIVFTGIVYALVKMGGPAFRAKAEEISGAIGEAARAREAAEKQRQEVAAKLANLDQDVAALREAAKKDAEAEAQRLRAMAKSEAEKIGKVAEAEIAAAARASRLELKALAARLAVERAEHLLRRDMTPTADAAMLGSFLTELEGGPN